MHRRTVRCLALCLATLTLVPACRSHAARAPASPGHLAVDLRYLGIAVRTLTGGAGADGVVVAGETPEHRGRVALIDGHRGSTRWTTDLAHPVVALADDQWSGGVWAVGGGDRATRTAGITRIDRSGRVAVTIPVPSGEPRSVAVSPRAVWVVDARGDAVWRVDPARGTVEARFAVPPHPVAIGVTGAGADSDVWVACATPGVVVRLDGRTGAVVATLAAPGADSVVVVDPSTIWVGGQSLLRIDATSSAVVDRVHGDGPLSARLSAGGWIWVRDHRGRVRRVLADGLRVEPTTAVLGEATDVAVASDNVVWLHEAAHRRLVAWSTPLPAGLRLVPAEEVHAGATTAYVRAIDGGSIRLDPIEALSDPAATDKAVLDGFPGITRAEGLPDGYYDRNRDGRTYRFPLSPRAVFVLLTFDGGATTPHPTVVSRERFARAMTVVATREFYGSPRDNPCTVTVSHATVTRVEQLYRP